MGNILYRLLKSSTGLSLCDLEFTASGKTRAEMYNSTKGDLNDYDCDKCLNRGDFAVEVDGEIIIQQCDCIKIRKSLKRIADSGLQKDIDKYTFDNYIVNHQWQELVMSKVKDFLAQSKNWLYLSGCVGCGKTHLSTATAIALLNSGKAVKYMLWRDEGIALKSCVNDEIKYKSLIEPLKKAEVLYIDDFLKTPKGKAPTDADYNLAFEIINYRYNNELTTIFSSEKSIDYIVEGEPAVGSRIYEMCKKFAVNIPNNPIYNYRINGNVKERI